jgi:hypothetical protein
VLRGLFSGFAILSLLLLAATAALWARSYGVRDSVRVRTQSGVVGGFASRGAIAVGWAGRGRRPMFSPVEYARQRPIDTATFSGSYGEAYGFPGVAALHIGPSRFMGYRTLLVVHDAILMALFAILPVWWVLSLPRRPVGRPCPSCGHRVTVVSEPCPECGAMPKSRPPAEPSAAGPLLRVAVVTIGLIAFFVWIWQYGGTRRSGSQGDDANAPARVWQAPPGDR